MKQFCKTALIAATTLTIFFTGNATAQEAPAEAPSVKGMTGIEADVLYFDAVKARNKGDHAEAERLLQAVIKLKPEEGGAYYDLARLSLPAKPDKAEEYIKKAIALDGNNKWYKDEYAQVLEFKNQFGNAAEVYDQLAAKEQHNEDYLLRSALMYQRAGDYKRSLEAIDKLIAKTGNDEEILLQKYQLYLKMNNVDGATKVIEQLISLEPSNGKYYSLLAEVYDNNKQPEKAMEVFTKAGKLFPDDPAVQLGIAEHYRKVKDTAQYNVYVKKALVNKGLDVESQLALLIGYMQELGDNQQRKKEALEIAAEIAASHSDNAQVLGVYGDLLSLNDQHIKAQEAYKKSLDIDPSRFPVWRNLLFNYTDRQSADSLIYYSEKAMRLFPNLAVVHELNGIGYSNKKNYPRAIRAFKRAIDLQPEEDNQQLAEMYLYLGDAYNSDKQYTASDSSFDKAISLTPDNASALNNYSYYLSVRGTRLDEAEKMSKRSLELRPGEATFLDTYGWILYKEGKYEKAKEYIQKAIDADKQNADATVWEHLGDITFKLGDKEKALEYWNKAKEKDGDNEQLNKKLQEHKLYE